MNQGKYNIAQQLGAKSIFASIEINARLSQSNRRVQIEYETPIETEWKFAIEFGANYFLQNIKVFNKHKKGLHIIVTRFHGNDVDTTSVLVSIVTIKALIDALKTSVYKEPFIDTEKFSYCFPF
jgi:hypothetical protein